MQRAGGADASHQVIETLAVMAAVAFMVAFVATAISRLGFPAPLTDVRGPVHQVGRVLDHEPLYPPPSSGYVPLIYPPLYYYASAATAKVIGIGYAPLRLTSLLASLVTLGLIGAWVWRETRQWRASVIAAGLFAATYRITDAWFDAERVDALSVAFLIASMFALRFSPTIRATAMAAVLMVLSALTKQTSLIVAAVLIVYLGVVDRRRAAVFGGTLVGGLALSALVLNWAEGGWYTFFVYRLASQGLGGALVLGRLAHVTYAFFSADLFGAVGIALAVGSLVVWSGFRDSGTRGDTARFFAAALAAVLVASFVSRVVHGSRANALIPAYAIIAIMFGLGLPRLASLLDARVVPRGWVWSLALAQIVILAYVPWHLREPLLSDTSDRVMIVGGSPGAPRATIREVAWGDTYRWKYADPTAVAELLLSAPPHLAATYIENLQHDLCNATDARPLILNALLFDADWQSTFRLSTTPAASLLPTWAQAAEHCRVVGVQR